MLLLSRCAPALAVAVNSEKSVKKVSKVEFNLALHMSCRSNTLFFYGPTPKFIGFMGALTAFVSALIQKVIRTI